MTRYKTINGETIECTAEEIADLDSMKADWDNKALDRAMASLRFLRTEKLKESDWMANSDVTMGPAWKGYRQQLRDLPSNYTTTDSQPLQEDLSNLEWPTKP